MTTIIATNWQQIEADQRAARGIMTAQYDAELAPYLCKYDAEENGASCEWMFDVSGGMCCMVRDYNAPIAYADKNGDVFKLEPFVPTCNWDVNDLVCRDQEGSCPALCLHCQGFGIVGGYDQHTGLTDCEPCLCALGRMTLDDGDACLPCQDNN